MAETLPDPREAAADAANPLLAVAAQTDDASLRVALQDALAAGDDAASVPRCARSRRPARSASRARSPQQSTPAAKVSACIFSQYRW